MAAPNQVSSTNAFPWRFVTPLYMGSALNPINSSLIATALVPIAAAVHVSVGRTAVLVSALYLASAIAQPTGGKLAEGVRAPRLDVTGIVGFGGTMTALLVFLMGLPHPDWIALSLAVVVGGGLVWWELRASHPFFDVRLLATNLALTRTYLRFALATLCVYTVLYGLTEWLQAGRGISAEEAGLLLLPMSAVSAVLIWPLSKRNLVRTPLAVAAVSCLAASAGVLALTTSTPIVWFVVITLVFGITLGTSISANQTTLYTQVTADRIGTASGLFRTFGYLGSIASSALISIVFHTSVTDHGLHVIALIMVVVSALGLVLVLADRTIMSQARLQRGPSASNPPLTPAPPANHQPNGKRDPVALTTLDPRPALVVIDLQKGLMAVPTAHPIEKVVDRAARLASAFRRHELPVVLVNATGTAPGRTEAGQARSSARPPPQQRFSTS